jgi:hypothetical protein
MKIVKICGGLGNQMFQYAFTHALKTTAIDKNIFIDISLYKTSLVRGGINFCHNGFELERVFGLPVSTEIASENDIKKLSTPADTFFHRLRRKYLTKKTHFIDKTFFFKSDFFTDTSDLYLEGYWQSHLYFNHLENQIHQLFSFALPLSAKSEEAFSLAGSNPVSIHVRRGDYLNSENLNVCTKEYFQNAISQMILECEKEQKPVTHFLVFSDDIEWCKNNLNVHNIPVTFVDWNKGQDSWQDMALMSKCNHNIIANSSFSWWGAFLNKNPAKKVFAPSLWNNRELHTKDTYYKYTFADVVPPEWTRINI